MLKWLMKIIWITVALIQAAIGVWIMSSINFLDQPSGLEVLGSAAAFLLWLIGFGLVIQAIQGQGPLVRFWKD